jgi:hypothetical protein
VATEDADKAEAQARVAEAQARAAEAKKDALEAKKDALEAKKDAREPEERARAAEERARVAKKDADKAEKRADKAKKDADKAMAEAQIAVADASLSNVHELSVIKDVKLVGGADTYGYKHGVIDGTSLLLNASASAENKRAADRIAGVLDILRADEVAGSVRDHLAGALSVANSPTTTTEASKLSLESLERMLDCAYNINLTSDTWIKPKVIALLAELCERERGKSACAASAEHVNEASTRFGNNPLAASMLRGVMCEQPLVDRDEIARTETSSTATVNLGKKRVADETVVIGTDRVFVSETALLSQIATDVHRIIFSKITAGMNSLTRYVFSTLIVNSKIDLRVTIPYAWRVLLDVPIACVDFGKPTDLTWATVLDYIRDMVAVARVMNAGREWTALEQSHVGDGSGDCRNPLCRQRDGRFADSPEAPRPCDTPTRKKTAHAALVSKLRGGTVLACKPEREDGGGLGVFECGERVLKVFVATHGAVVREAKNEIAMHELLTVHARAAIMPLLSVTYDNLFSACDQLHKYVGFASGAIVLETERANGDKIDWAALAGDALALRGEQLLVALAAIAACDVVHGDVKPGNVVVHNGRVRFIDFGLSTTVDLFTRLSKRVLAAGTRGFMAPEVEQARDNGRADRTMHVSLAVDVYSAGCMLALAGGAVAACEPLRRLVARMKAHSAAQRPTAQRALDEWRSTVAPELRSQLARKDDSAPRRASPKDTNAFVARAGAASPRKVPQKNAALGVGDKSEAEKEN